MMSASHMTYISWEKHALWQFQHEKHVALSLYNWRYPYGNQQPTTNRAERESSYKQSIRKCIIQNKISALKIIMFSTSEACKIYDRKYSLDILATLWYEK